MDRQRIFEKVVFIVKDVFDADGEKITERTGSDDIDAWDSLTHLELIGEIERAFQIKFSMQEIMKIENVGQILNIVEGKMK